MNFGGDILKKMRRANEIEKVEMGDLSERKIVGGERAVDGVGEEE